ncbi:lysylphosphatidylglycerol synthase domain-containing protein [Nocardioides seonyuensis]|uniref:lysylphosphatidylglycerol synthase domain-containing protein n=1 Tax=Nocardioides seonyuensis TaxID=2518371 RepID=UPI001423D608|nr:lysylphosphatidylglycerol synthase domain-containing protein [Nocardioides seonyuensis]
MRPPPRGRALRATLAVLIVLGSAYVLAAQGEGLSTAVRELSPGRVALSALAAIVGGMCVERTWLSLLNGFGVDVPHRDAAAGFYTTQLGKYVPGSVWPVLAQVHLGARLGVPRRMMLGASLLLLVMVTASGTVVGALLLPWSSADSIARYWWLLLLLPALLLLLHPRVVMWLIDRASLVTSVEQLDARVSPQAVLRAGIWSVLGWVVLGCHLLVLLSAYEALDLRLAVASVGGIALAWAAGLAFIPAPAGAGVREGVLLLTLAPLVGTQPALAVALASRVLLTLSDLTLAAGSVSLRALRRIIAERAARSARGREESGSAP